MTACISGNLVHINQEVHNLGFIVKMIILPIV